MNLTRETAEKSVLRTAASCRLMNPRRNDDIKDGTRRTDNKGITRTLKELYRILEHNEGKRNPEVSLKVQGSLSRKSFRCAARTFCGPS
jgi:hypothetical protein